MKPIQLLTRQVDQWWRDYVTDAPRSRQPKRTQVYLGKSAQTNPASSEVNRPLYQKIQFRTHPSAVLVLAVISLTSTIGYRFYNAPKLAVGTAAPETIKAPYTTSVEDTKSTEDKRKQERTGAVPVLMLNQVVNQEIYRELYRILNQGTELRETAGAFPYIERWTLALSTQQYLRHAEEWEWRVIREAVSQEVSEKPLPLPSSKDDSSLVTSVNQMTVDQQQAIAELLRLKQSVSPLTFSSLLDRIVQARQDYQLALQIFTDKSTPEARAIYDITLFELSDADWEATQRGMKDTAARILAQGIPRGLPQNLLRNAVSLQISGLVPLEAEPMAIELLASVLKANLTEDAEQTRLRAEQAAKAVEPVYIQVSKGEAIVQAGEVITHPDFVLIDYFGLSRRGINWDGLIGFGTLVSGAVIVFWLVERRFHPEMRRRDYLLVLLLTLSAPLFVSLGIASTSLPAVGLLIGSFYGSTVGATAVTLLSILLPIGMEIGWSDGLASAAGGLVGGVMAGRMRSREEMALLGVAVGVAQGGVYLLVTLTLSAAAGIVWQTILLSAAVRSISGIAWSIVALGLSPYLEHLFDLVTPVRLAELANPNRPLLQRLARETPGTFQHTLFVSTLAEAAARELNCNVELVRAGTLYHDIGKMHDPMGFCENQMGGPNKHDTEIQDPWKSAEIIKKHVSEGLMMARKYRLPKAIQAFIPEHQGTMLIAYFYHQAQEMAQEDPAIVVRESDFRYDGPIPQSRETGILMLADSCEAALRSLKEATYEEALAMVNKILRARWQDDQLVDSGLTREEMNTIADVFVRVWQQFHHKRVAYPKNALVANK